MMGQVPPSVVSFLLLVVAGSMTVVQGANCSSSFSAGVFWPASAANTTVCLACSSIDPTLFQSELLASRHCGSNGTWSEVDLTTCALLPVNQSFALVWIALNTTVINNLNAIAGQLKTAATNYSLPVTGDVILLSSLQQANETILTFRLGLNLTSPPPSYVANVSLKINILVTNISIASYTVLKNSSSYQLIIYSDFCQCQPSGNVAFLCSGMTPPCFCALGMSCVCQSPFVGDGFHCTSDFDGDDYPSVRLDTCPTNSTAKYCSQDVCPNVYNPLQNTQDCKFIPGFMGCPFETDPIWGITWANTRYGVTDMQKCLNSPSFATRKCTLNGWLKPNTSLCQSYQFINIKAQVTSQLLQSPTSIAALTSSLVSLTSPTQTTPTQPLDLNATNFILKSVDRKSVV